MPNLLFVCSRNRKRSPTAEVVFRDWPGVKTLSAGTAPDAETPLDVDLIEWADIVFAMEGRHRKALQSRFGTRLRDKKLVCLQIPDDFEFMDPVLVERLKGIVPRWLPK